MTEKYIKDPIKLIDLTKTECYSLPRESVEEIRLEVLRNRFAQLKETVPMLTHLANSQNISEIQSLEDIGPLLFRQNTYKSYPAKWLENCEFNKLTTWLGKLTATDISHIDASGCELIEDWLKLLEEETDLLVNYSSTLGGKLTFIPRSKDDWNVFCTIWLGSIELFGDNAGDTSLKKGVDVVPILFPGPKKGYRAQNHLFRKYEEWFGDDLVVTPMDELNADLMSVAGRVATASKKGELGAVTINPKLLEMKKKIQADKEAAPKKMEDWFEYISKDCLGQRVIIYGTRNLIWDLVEKCVDRGIKGAFSSDSVVKYGGVFPDGNEPEGWLTTTQEVLGIPAEQFFEAYGASEVLSVLDRCENGHYHIPPTVIPYLLNPETGELLQRTGKSKGQLAFFDLLAENYWGGIITPDEATVNWESDCGCGRTGQYIEGDITQLSEADKINCSGTTKAHDDAADFIIG